MSQRLEIPQSAQALSYCLDDRRNGVRFLPMTEVVSYKHPEKNVKLITHFHLTPTLRTRGSTASLRHTS